MTFTRSTRQKELLSSLLQYFPSFFNAHDLLQKAKKHDPKVGIATIYRFLSQITSQGQIHSYLCDRKTIYSTSKENHSHFHCEICNTTKHLNLNSLNFLKEQKIGQICHIQLDVTGICQSCLKKDK